jgi:hypothetical protein
MTALQRLGGFAAITQGFLLIVLLVCFFVLFPAIGAVVPNEMDLPSTILEGLKTNRIGLAVASSAGIISAIIILLIALAVRDRFGDAAANHFRLAIPAASIASAFFFLDAIIAFTAYPHLANLYSPDRQDIIAAYRAILLIDYGTFYSYLFSSGAFTLLVGAAGLKTNGLPKGLSYFLMIAGLIGMTTFVIPILQFVGVVMAIVWGFWLGIVLIRP